MASSPRAVSRTCRRAIGTPKRSLYRITAEVTSNQAEKQSANNTPHVNIIRAKRGDAGIEIVAKLNVDIADLGFRHVAETPVGQGFEKLFDCD